MKPEAEPGLEPEPDAPGALVPFDAEAAFVDAEAAFDAAALDAEPASHAAPADSDWSAPLCAFSEPKLLLAACVCPFVPLAQLTHARTQRK